MTLYEQETVEGIVKMDNRKICPLIATGNSSCVPNCLEEKCALWNEDRQKCAIAIIMPRNK